jgi:hypothetical protein
MVTTRIPQIHSEIGRKNNTELIVIATVLSVDNVALFLKHLLTTSNRYHKKSRLN